VTRLATWYDVDDVTDLKRALADAPAGGAFRMSLREIEEKLAVAELPFTGPPLL
jgi:hypothetical protein